jgi:RNA polymerase sigma-70 factor (ECF subfamily)
MGITVGIAGSGEPNFHELVASARRGDRDSFERLMALHAGFLVPFVERTMDVRLRVVLDAEDVLQDVRLAAFRSLADADFPAPEAFRGWLETIAKNRLIDLVRRHCSRRRQEGRALSLDETVGRSESGGSIPRKELVPGADPTASSIATRREAAEALEGVLARIAPHYRQVIRFVFVDRMPTTEIASRMGKSPEAVRKIFSRALEACGEVLGWKGAFEPSSGRGGR